MSQTTYCVRHKDTPSNLRCGKCDDLICPRCMVHTPVGARCEDCAQVTPVPTYNVSRTILARAIGASIGLGIAGGVALILLRALGLGFDLFSLAIVAAGLGFIVGEGVGAAANRKRGRTLQYAAVGGVLISYAVVFAARWSGPLDLLAIGISLYVAYLRLR